MINPLLFWMILLLAFTAAHSLGASALAEHRLLLHLILVPVPHSLYEAITVHCPYL
jgi:hypothetical protein